MNKFELSKKWRRRVNLRFGKLKPKWWTKYKDEPFNRKEKKRRRAKDKRAKASRKRNRSK